MGIKTVFDDDKINIIKKRESVMFSYSGHQMINAIKNFSISK